MITDSQKGEIQDFVKIRPVELVYLLGSRAKGQAKPYSDYDFAILFDESLDKRARFEEKLVAISFLTKLLASDKVDVIDLSDASPALRYEAISPRATIYAKSENTRVDFEQRSLAEYFDRLYYLKRHAQASLQRVAREGLASS